MFNWIKGAIYYLRHGETREEHDRREKEYIRRQKEVEREIAREARKERKQKRRDEAYRRFLTTNQVTECEAPKLDQTELREQRKAAMRFAKDMQDSMPD